MKNKRNVFLLIVLLLLVGLTGGYVASTYAKYASEVKGNQGTVTVAKWNFEEDNAKQTFTVELDETYDASTLIGGKIAPGTSGSFNIRVSNATSEVGVDFTIELNDITNVPTNLKFYKDASYTTELTPGTSTITGQLERGETALNVPIYWKWAYETTDGDEADTADGIAANTLTIDVTIKGVQTEPSTTGITSHIN